MNELVYHQFKNDPRFLEAKKNLMDLYAEYQKKITGIKSADTQKVISYEETLKEFEKLRASKLWYPYLGSGMGNRCLVELIDGSIKYDFISGIGVHFAHGHPKVIEASIDAAMQDLVMQGNLQQNKDIVDLAKLITSQAKMDHIFFSTSGAMACENALKIIFQKHYPKKRLIAFDRCFMGRTTTLSQITDKAAYREGLPSTISVDYLPYFDPQNPQISTENAIKALKKLIERYPNDYAAICLEVIQGEGGCWVGNKEFFKEILKVAKANSIAIFIDEVQSFARTSRLFAFQHFELDEFADIVTIGKISQICATLFNKEYAPKPGLISQTFTGSTSAILSCKAILNDLLNGGYFGENGKHVLFHNHFKAHLERLEHMSNGKLQGPFGIGAMVAFTVFKGDKDKSIEFTKKLYDNGLIVFVAGQHPTRIRMLLPSGGITLDDIDQSALIIEKTLKEFDAQ